MAFCSLAGKQIQVLSGHLQWVYCCSISPDCSMLCSAAGEKSVSLQHACVCVRVRAHVRMHVLSHSPSASVSQQRWLAGSGPHTTLGRLEHDHDHGEEALEVGGGGSFSRR